jgi:hypothetical protein
MKKAIEINQKEVFVDRYNIFTEHNNIGISAGHKKIDIDFDYSNKNNYDYNYPINNIAHAFSFHEKYADTGEEKYYAADYFRHLNLEFNITPEQKKAILEEAKRVDPMVILGERNSGNPHYPTEIIYTFNSYWDGGWDGQLSEARYDWDNRIHIKYKETWYKEDYHIPKGYYSKSKLAQEIKDIYFKNVKFTTIRNYIDNNFISK